MLAVWSGANLPHLLTGMDAPPVSQAASVTTALGVGDAFGSTSPSPSAGASGSSSDAAATDVATAGAAARLALADRRVSRQQRTAPLTGAVAGSASKVPARPAVKPAKPAARWVRPSAGGESSCFCMRWGVMHEGIDLAGPLGSPIVAVGDGVVVEAGPAAGYGMWVAIRHANGDYTIYGHMYRYYVRVGQHVRAGQRIADIGANGRSTGPHLHFGVTRGSATGPFIDPVPWLKARGVDVGPYDPGA